MVIEMDTEPQAIQPRLVATAPRKRISAIDLRAMRGATGLAIGFVWIVMVTSVDAQDRKREVYPLSAKCLSAGRELLESDGSRGAHSVTDECVAAAIAERAFLKHVHNESKYSVWPMDHTKSKWYFMFMGETHGPPAPGEQWMVKVSRSTGKTEIVDGA